MKDAILELGVEHLPARFVPLALAQLEAKGRALLAENRLEVKGIETHGTLRRLAVILTGVAEKSLELEQVVTGPPARLWRNDKGEFTPQSAGFAKNQGVSPDALEVVQTPKGEFLQARKKIVGEPAAAVLARVFPALIASLEFPKMMEWEATRFKFARPIRNLLAVFGGRVVPFEIAGVKSGGKALPSSASAKPIAVSDPSSYVKALRDECVLVRVDDRRKALSTALDQASAQLRVKLDKDEALLEETVYMTEYPAPVVGHFDKDFLRLPQVFLSTVLKKQLKFFPVLAEGGALAPHFIGVRDGASEGQKEVQDGYERVLEARFNDARFFYQRDLKTRLRDKQDRLKGVAFHKELGSMYDKRERVVELAIWLSGLLWRKDIDANLGDVEAIARLAYADLVTDVVKEFPELQAAMGGHYARRDDEGEKVALGIEEFYYPLGAGSSLPTTIEGSLVALAGKVDTLSSMLLVGLKPTGSEDPFALRRAGMGIIRIVLGKQFPISIPMIAKKSRELILARGHRKPDAAPSEADFLPMIDEFLWQRAATFFEGMKPGYTTDEIQAVEENGLEDIIRTFKRLCAVHSMRSNPEFLPLAAAFKRASNILKQANVNLGDAQVINRSLITQEAESSLFDAMGRIEKNVVERIAREDYENGLKRLVELKPCVDRFFESVRVMDAADDVKRNRLALLASLVRLFKSVADISRLQASN
ncbi:MAG: glycine--tRNA ligase subunit beta [Elusimicrobia bacterium]|nr:glycine--tRNA ligase subunit beta [Elusimicrobiota bacterium]